MAKVFIDGSAGTTGLRIRERLEVRDDITLIEIPDELRKDAAAITERMLASDITFLCLPDAAAQEAVGYVADAGARGPVIIDTSTAHRTATGWTYGFPEITGRDVVAQSRRIANPGCHASGFVALVAPLVRAGIVLPGAELSCFSLTGYSGGGKKMIAQYEAPREERDPLLEAPRMYGLTQMHKHLAEMRAVCTLTSAPVFCPVVAPFYAGMEVTVPLTPSCTTGGALPSAQDLCAVYSDFYGEGLVSVAAAAGEHEEGFLSAGLLAGFDDMQITVCGNEQRIMLVSRFDNLGKGASGSAIQNMNIVLGIDERTGLKIHG